MPEGRKVRWGIISTANIGTEKVIPGILKSPHSEVVAIASRDLARAHTAIQHLGLRSQARAYGTYEELLADPMVDAVYNPLPNHLHVPLTLAAARAGKHVLCEKPIAMNAKEAEELRQIPPGIVFYEAFMVRFHPQWHRAREIVRSGELGEVRAIRAVFSYFNVDPSNVRNQADIGGGGIMDIGCYPIVGSRFLFEAEPVRAVALVDRDPTFRTDRLASVILDYGNGRQASFICSTQLVPHQSVEVLGTRGRVEIKIPFNAPKDTPTAIEIDTGAALGGTLARREIIRAVDQYTEEAEAFALAVLGEKPLPYGVEDAIQNMRIIDAIFESERTGGWVNIGR
ncbi:MAG TPA: Gfo/Idh/MocA family oxidoreductase [Alphaproteobacteria bacterium]|nr:Gfo/Idh/MocA family oxidoreductase [Alphaproteobacteria bacterium]